MVQEADCCDSGVKHSRRVNLTGDDVVRIFSRLMLQGKVKAAVRWATERTRGELLMPTDVVDNTSGTTVLDVLRQKHPSARPPKASSLVPCDVLPLFEDVKITGSHLLFVAHHIQGDAGPGGCDAGHWRDVLLRFGAYSSRLRDAVAALARRLLNSIVPWEDISALVENCLIALDKCPGVHPIGNGETLRLVVGKAVCYATRVDVELACGSDQLCGGVRSGIEGAIHAMTSRFLQYGATSGWSVLLVDASNAFNSLNRVALLWNVSILWPRCSRFVFNTYQGWATLVVRSSNEHLYSVEGVTQGDPLSMFLYAVGTLPLIQSLKGSSSCVQVWYADDASACGSLSDLHQWFELLLSKGSDFGYVVNPAKCCLVIHDSYKSNAEQLFSSLGISVVCNHRYLGGFIGELTGQASFVRDKVHRWIADVQCLSKIAEKQPQAAFAALTKSLQCEWQFLQRVIPNCGSYFIPLDDVLASTFLPAVFGCEVTPHERLLFSLPVRFGGLGVSCPQCTAEFAFSASRNATQVIVQALHGSRAFEADRHKETVLRAHKDFVRQSELRHDEFFSTLLPQFDGVCRRSVERAKLNDLSGWLTVLPTSQDHFDQTAQEFRDALALRYRKHLLNVPSGCDGCGAPFSLDHALVCRKGGLIIQRHNEVRDAVGDLAALVWD